MKKLIAIFLFFAVLRIGDGAEPQSPLYTLSACAIFKNEAPYLKEWIEYHKLVGVEHFYLYNNDSTDNFSDVLAPYIQAGEVTLVSWPNQKKNEWKNRIWAWVFTTQVTAYEHAFWASKGKTKWIAVIDIDEFVVPVKAEKITDVLDKYEKHFPGVEVFWDIFGTSDVDTIPSDKVMIELMHKKAFKAHPWNSVAKTILKPDLYKDFYRPPHGCRYTNGFRHYEVPKDELVINHYINKCKDYFYKNKIKNKETMDNVKFSEQEVADMLKMGNDVEDEKRVIQRFVPALRKNMQPAEKK